MTILQENGTWQPPTVMDKFTAMEDYSDATDNIWGNYTDCRERPLLSYQHKGSDSGPASSSYTSTDPTASVNILPTPARHVQPIQLQTQTEQMPGQWPISSECPSEHESHQENLRILFYMNKLKTKNLKKTIKIIIFYYYF